MYLTIKYKDITYDFFIDDFNTKLEIKRQSEIIKEEIEEKLLSIYNKNLNSVPDKYFHIAEIKKNKDSKILYARSVFSAENVISKRNIKLKIDYRMIITINFRHDVKKIHRIIMVADFNSAKFFIPVIIRDYLNKNKIKDKINCKATMMFTETKEKIEVNHNNVVF